MLKLVIITSVSGHTNRAVFCPLSTDGASSRWRSSVRPLETSEFTRRRTINFCNSMFSLIATVINTRSLAVAKRPCDCPVNQFWSSVTGRRYFVDIIGLSSTIVT